MQATWRVCIICRMTDQINKRQKAAEARRRSSSVTEGPRTKNVTPSPLQEATNGSNNLFQVSTPATYTASSTSTTTTTFPALFTWSAAPSFVQPNGIPSSSSSSSSTLSASQRIYMSYSNNSSSTLSMALQPTTSVSEQETSVPQVNTVPVNQEVPEDIDYLGRDGVRADTTINEESLSRSITEQGDDSTDMNRIYDTANNNPVANSRLHENHTNFDQDFEVVELYEENLSVDATLYNGSGEVDSGTNTLDSNAHSKTTGNVIGEAESTIALESPQQSVMLTPAATSTEAYIGGSPNSFQSNGATAETVSKQIY